MAESKFIDGAIHLIIGLILMPIIAGFIAFANSYVVVGGANFTTNPNVTALEQFPGMIAVLTVVGYVFAFALVYSGIKTMKG